jgi:hypothetical protein
MAAYHGSALVPVLDALWELADLLAMALGYKLLAHGLRDADVTVTLGGRVHGTRLSLRNKWSALGHCG